MDRIHSLKGFQNVGFFNIHGIDGVRIRTGGGRLPLGSDRRERVRWSVLEAVAKKVSAKRTWRAGSHVVDGLNTLGLDEEMKNVSYREMDSLGNGESLMVASVTLKKGDTVFSVPENLWLTRSAVEKESTMMQTYKNIKDLDSWVVLALFLMYEQSAQETKWSGYVRGLVDECSVNVPLLWNDDEVAMLEGTQISDSIESYRRFFIQTYRNIMDEGIVDALFPGDEDAFVKAACIVRGCSHEPFSGDNLTLVPGVEGLGYHKKGSPGENCVLEVQSGLFGGQKALVVKSLCPVENGMDLCFDVAPGCTQGHVLLNHGMIDFDAPGTFAITLVLPEDDKFYDDKIDILELNGLQASSEFILQTGSPPPDTMLAMLRLINLDNQDAFLLESIFRNEVWSHVNLPVSEENERAVYESMTSGCASVLQSYPTKLEDDIALLKTLQTEGAKNHRARMAVALRLGEKEVLEGTLRFFEDRLGILKDLEYYGERRLKRLGLLDKEGKPTDWDSFFDDGIA